MTRENIALALKNGVHFSKKEAMIGRDIEQIIKLR